MFYKEEKQQQTETKPYRKSQTKSFVGVFMILVAVSLYVFMLKPVSLAVDEKEQEVLTRQSEVNVLQEKIDSFKKQEEDLQLNDEKKRAILSAIPIGINQDEVIRDVVEVATKNDITLRSISFSKNSTGQNNVNVLRVSASFEGSYTDLINFLQGVEGNQRRFMIGSISVQMTAQSSTMTDRVAFSLTMDSFYQE